jgi:hypothetical protein
MHQICLCLSTGRSGTTYLAHVLSAAYGHDFDVFHEDILEHQAKPRRYLWYFSEPDFAELRRDSDISRHLDRIATRSSVLPYTDVGFPCLPLVPLIIATFPGRVRLLHLVRDPISVSASMTTLGQYDPEMSLVSHPGYAELPNPLETRCAHPEYAGRWMSMTAFEKGLWRWAEYNLLALTIHERHPELPYLKMSSDTLFTDADAPGQVAKFFGLPPRDMLPEPKFRNATNPNLTYYHPVGDEWRRYVHYPYVLELAEQLGVPVRSERLEAEMKKYAAPSASQLRKYRWRLRFTTHWWRTKLEELRSLLKISSRLLATHPDKGFDRRGSVGKAHQQGS